MGLDVYLYHYEDFEKTREIEKKIEAYDEKAWEGTDYDKMSDEEKDVIRAKIQDYKSSLTTLDCYGEAQDSSLARKQIEFNDERYPDHYFKIGYFRSSYNSSGINNVLGKLINLTLYDLFPTEKDADSYYRQPDWNQSKELTQQAIETLEKTIGAGNDYHVLRVSYNALISLEEQTVSSEQEAIQLLIKKKRESGGNFSCREGEFFFDKPLQVCGIIRGAEPNIIRQVTKNDNTKEPCFYVVYKHGEDGLSWYVQALEIVKATCEYVLSQPDPQKYRLHWSS